MTSTRVLTADTVRPEQFGDYVGRDWRGTPGLQAGWSVGFGPVTRVLFLQSLGADGAPPPLLEPAAGVWPETRERQWLREVNPYRPACDGVRLFELRTYDVRVGLGCAFLRLMLGALPIRSQYSSNFGIWESQSGRQEQILHLWGYRSLEERDQVRGSLKTDPDWQAYTAKILPMLQTLQSFILYPLPHC